MIEELTIQASAAYSKIITRYPVMLRGDDAKKRLAALHQPIPHPTKAAVAQNRKEEESRRESDAMARLMSLAKKGPDVEMAAHVGDPTLVDPTPIAASKESGATAMRAMNIGKGEHDVSVEIGKSGTPGANEPAPRSDTPPAVAGSDPFSHTGTNASDPNELKPAAEANTALPAGKPDANELTPAADSQSNAAVSAPPLPPPVQVNEIQQGQAGSSSTANASADASSTLATDQDVSSSKKKKKKGLKKIVTF
jgi:outer membrane protein assembly factor BamD